VKLRAREDTMERAKRGAPKKFAGRRARVGREAQK
jgi:hypothetical protein